MPSGKHEPFEKPKGKLIVNTVKSTTLVQLSLNVGSAQVDAAQLVVVVNVTFGGQLRTVGCIVSPWQVEIEVLV